MGVEIFISFSIVYIMMIHLFTRLDVSHVLIVFSLLNCYLPIIVLSIILIAYIVAAELRTLDLIVQIVKDHNTVNIYLFELKDKILSIFLNFRLHCQERKGPYAYFSSLSHFRHVCIEISSLCSGLCPSHPRGNVLS